MCMAVIVSVGVGSVAADGSGECRVQVVVVFGGITPCSLVNSCRQLTVYQSIGRNLEEYC
jgi:hypothetical protein